MDKQICLRIPESRSRSRWLADQEPQVPHPYFPCILPIDFQASFMSQFTLFPGILVAFRFQVSGHMQVCGVRLENSTGVPATAGFRCQERET